jgi:hypothetical protein
MLYAINSKRPHRTVAEIRPNRGDKAWLLFPSFYSALALCCENGEENHQFHPYSRGKVPVPGFGGNTSPRALHGS